MASLGVGDPFGLASGVDPGSKHAPETGSARLRIEALAEGRRADEVDEENGDGLAHVAKPLEPDADPAPRAEARIVGVLAATRRAPAHRSSLRPH